MLRPSRMIATIEWMHRRACHYRSSRYNLDMMFENHRRDLIDHVKACFSCLLEEYSRRSSSVAHWQHLSVAGAPLPFPADALQTPHLTPLAAVEHLISTEAITCSRGQSRARGDQDALGAALAPNASAAPATPTTLFSCCCFCLCAGTLIPAIVISPTPRFTCPSDIMALHRARPVPTMCLLHCCFFPP